VAQRNLNLLTGRAGLASLVGRLGAAVSPEAVELTIGRSTVGRADFAAAHEHGLAKSTEPPRGWNHSGLGLGRETVPVAAVRRGRDGWRFFNLRKPGRLDPGTPVRMLGRELPALLQQALGVADLTAANVAAALGSRGDPVLLRFATRDGEGRSGGYSIVVAP